jgi:dethiobiotin synthetase/adenosylmethionine--8-amino-7-oxononanoate aminotransferase
VHKTLSSWAAAGVNHALVETAGGVHSPGPNGNLQSDLYRPLRLPVVLVADPRLGGISSSISAFESLLIRGYDVHYVLVFKDDYYQNHQYLQSYFQKRNIPLLALPQPPERPPVEDAKSLAKDEEAMSAYYEDVARRSDLGSLVETLSTKYANRIEQLESMAGRAHDVIWYPFTQHQGMEAKDITVIESAHDDYFQTYRADGDKGTSLLQPTFDGSASWWTQGLGHANPDLSLAAAYAAGRYGHVMFAGAIHEPALSLAELLISSLGNPRLQKVFYSDNGSTGMEVAVKMGLRAACSRYGWSASKDDTKILGLKGSYHGDTMGVMDCSEPSTYNKKVEWYRGRGYWFDFPQVKMSQGVWRVEVPEDLRADLGPDLEFSSFDAVFDLKERQASDAGKRYRAYIKDTLQELVQSEGKKFGALIMEPIILGAGGMLFA